MFDARDSPEGSAAPEGFLTPVNVASSLFFETPEAIFRRVCSEIRPRTPVPPVSVEYKAFANADSHVRLEQGAIHVRISDLLESAPAPVTEALAQILLGKLFAGPPRASMNTGTAST